MRYWKINAVAAIACLAALLAAGCGGGGGKAYEEGEKLYGAGKYEEALGCFDGAMKANPDKAEYHIAYAKTLAALGRYEKARDAYIDVIRDADNKIVRENNKKAYMGIAVSYYYEGVYDQAKAYFEIALKNEELPSFDEDINAYVAECDMYLYDYDSALNAWNKIIGDGSKNAGYYLGRAKANTALGNSKDAESDFKSAIANDGDCYPAYIGLYLMLSEEGDEEGATEVFNEAQKRLEKDDDVFYRSVLYYYGGDADKALEGFNKAVEDGNNEAYYYIGRISQDKEDYEGAAADYEKYYETCPSEISADFCNQYSGCLLELGRYDEAEEWISKGVLMAAGSVRQKLMSNEVIICEKTGDYDAAAEKAEEYLKEYKDADMEREYEFIKTRRKDK